MNSCVEELEINKKKVSMIGKRFKRTKKRLNSEKGLNISEMRLKMFKERLKVTGKWLNMRKERFKATRNELERIK